MKLNAGCGEDLRLGWCNIDNRIPEAVQNGPWIQPFPDDSNTWEAEHLDDNGNFYETYFRKMDLTEPWPWEGFFSEIHMVDVLEHLPNPLPVARQVHKALKPGGLWVIKVPHAFSHRGLSSWDHATLWTKDKIQWLARGSQQDSHPAHAARDLHFNLEKCRYQWPNTLGGLLRGFPPIHAVYSKPETSEA